MSLCSAMYFGMCMHLSQIEKKVKKLVGAKISTNIFTGEAYCISVMHSMKFHYLLK